MTLATKLERLTDRRALLEGLDRFHREADATGLMDGLDEFEDQAFNLILGKRDRGFRHLRKKIRAVVAKYDKGLGQQMLVARRLCEAGCGFVTLNFGGWDMHGQIEAGDAANRGPMVDRAVAAFVDDIAQRGLSEKILLVVTGEFGRTPRVNRNAGRDHWAPLSTLALAGGGLKMGQVVGESNSNAEVPEVGPDRPARPDGDRVRRVGNRSEVAVHEPGRPPGLSARRGNSDSRTGVVISLREMSCRLARRLIADRSTNRGAHFFWLGPSSTLPQRYSELPFSTSRPCSNECGSRLNRR